MTLVPLDLILFLMDSRDSDTLPIREYPKVLMFALESMLSLCMRETWLSAQLADRGIADSANQGLKPHHYLGIED